MGGWGGGGGGINNNTDNEQIYKPRTLSRNSSAAHYTLNDIHMTVAERTLAGCVMFVFEQIVRIISDIDFR